MEMHQVRYFLAVARLLNFTRAAEACNVAQPSLTRAISMLEAEFGGDLFRRERRNTHLTQLGDRMLPILRQCYESAQSAKALASSVKTGGKVSLTIAIGDTVDIAIIVPQIQELARGIKGLEFALMRGPQEKIAEDLKSGAAEVAVTESFDQPWDRLDMWPLITERFVFACSKSHRLAGRSSVDLRELAGEHSIVGNSCEALDTVLSALNADRKDTGVGPGLLSEHDCVALIAANLAVGVLPARCARSDGISTGNIATLEPTRSISAYGVSGRRRSPAANTFIKLLRAADWSPAAVEPITLKQRLPRPIQLVPAAFVAPVMGDKIKQRATEETHGANAP